MEHDEPEDTLTVLHVDFVHAKDPSPDDPLLIKNVRHDYRACKHYRILVDSRHRVVTCEDCEKEVDPYYWLNMVGDIWNNNYWASEAWRSERKRLVEEVEDLKRKRRNLKAQIRRLEKKIT